jgi:hypothetical protein
MELPTHSTIISRRTYKGGSEEGKQQSNTGENLSEANEEDQKRRMLVLSEENITDQYYWRW